MRRVAKIGLGLLIAIVAGAAGVGAYLISDNRPVSYRATAHVISANLSTSRTEGSGDVQDREVRTLQALATSSYFFEKTEATIGIDDLESKTRVQVVSGANALNISVDGRSSREAADRATGVARALVSEQAAISRRQLDSQRALAAALSTPQPPRPGSPPAPDIESSSAVSVGSLVDIPAARPTEPASPKPEHNALIAVLAVLFVAALVGFLRTGSHRT